MAVKEYIKGVWELLKKNHKGIITICTTVFVGMFFYACQTTTKSIINPEKRVSRAELQLELETLKKRAEIGMADLDQQDAIKQMILQNAIMIASGGTLNPVGILSGIAALYGITAATSGVVSTVKRNRKNSGTTNA